MGWLVSTLSMPPAQVLVHRQKQPDFKLPNRFSLSPAIDLSDELVTAAESLPI